VIKNQSDGYRLRRVVRTMIDRRAAVATLLKNEAASVALDAIGEAVLRVDIRGNVIYLNGMAAKMTGWSREEALGAPSRRCSESSIAPTAQRFAIQWKSQYQKIRRSG
jgi:PAS domain-containing protein